MGFDSEQSITFDTGGGDFTDADTEALKRVENELATNFDYGWLISEYDMTDADRPPSVFLKKHGTSTEADKKKKKSSKCLSRSSLYQKKEKKQEVTRNSN